MIRELPHLGIEAPSNASLDSRPGMLGTQVPQPRR